MFTFKGFDFTVSLTKNTILVTNGTGGQYEFRRYIDVQPTTVVDAPKRTPVRLYPVDLSQQQSKFKVATLHEPLSNGQKILLEKVGLELCKM